MSNRNASKRKSKNIKKGGGSTSKVKCDNPPLMRRAGAYAVDWFLGELFATFPVVMCYSLLYNTAILNSNLQDLPRAYAILAGIFSMIFSVFYFAVIPWKCMKGKTIGKRIFHLKMIRMNGTETGFGQLLLRQLLWVLLLEGSLLGANRYFWMLLSIITGWDWFTTYPQYVVFALVVISAIVALFTPHRRALHDYATGTRVVFDL